jgi:hypothetical protein
LDIALTFPSELLDVIEARCTITIQPKPSPRIRFGQIPGAGLVGRERLQHQRL